MSDDIPFTAAEISAVVNKTMVKQVSKKLDLRVLATTKPPKYDFVIPGLLRGSVGALVCAGGTGKSMAMLEASAAIACICSGGRDILGMGIERQGRVVYLAGEDPEVALHHRFHDVMKHFPGVAADAIFNNLDLHSMSSADRDLMDDDWVDWLIDTATSARLIVIDTLSRFHLLDENDTADAKRLMRRMERIASKTGAALLFLHHVNKSSVGSRTAHQQQAARGSSVFIDDARWSSFMEVMDQKEAMERNIDDKDYRMFVKWNINKQNYSAPIADVWLKRHEGGILLLTDFLDNEKSAQKYVQASQPATGGNDDDKY